MGLSSVTLFSDVFCKKPLVFIGSLGIFSSLTHLSPHPSHFPMEKTHPFPYEVSPFWPKTSKKVRDGVRDREKTRS